MQRFLVVAFAVVCATLQLRAVTLDEIVAKHLEARGGLQAITALHSLKIEGSMTMQGMDTKFTHYFKDGKVRLDVEVMGQAMTQAFDGKQAWVKTPQEENARIAPEEQTSRAAAEADFTGAYVNTKSKGISLEYVGTVDVEVSTDAGSPETTTAYKIKVTHKDGSTSNSYIDAVTWMEVQTEDVIDMGGESMTIKRAYADYKPVAGVQFPMLINVFYNGNVALTMKRTSTDSTTAIDDALFAVPAGAKSE